MGKYRISIIAEAQSSLSKSDLESMLVASLYDVETGEKISDGENIKLDVIDYELTEAIPINEGEL